MILAEIVVEYGRTDDRGTASEEAKPTLTLLARPSRSPHNPRIIADQTRTDQGRLVSITERANYLDGAAALQNTPDAQHSWGSPPYELSPGKSHIASRQNCFEYSLRDALSVVGESKDIPHMY